MKNIKLKINHHVNYTNDFTKDFTKDFTNEFPDEVEDNFIEEFYKIENKYIGLPNTAETSHSYKYYVTYLCRNFKIPRSKISWREY